MVCRLLGFDVGVGYWWFTGLRCVIDVFVSHWCLEFVRLIVLVCVFLFVCFYMFGLVICSWLFRVSERWFICYCLLIVYLVVMIACWFGIVVFCWLVWLCCYRLLRFV